MIYPLHEAVVTIGRGPDNIIQIIDPRMSRNHTTLQFRDTCWHARDNGSKNGTWVNGEQICGEYRLTFGDLIQVGETTFCFEQESVARDLAATSGSGMRLLQDDKLIVPSHVIRLNEENTPVPSSTRILHDNDRHRLEVLYKVMDVTSTLQDLDDLLEHVVDLILSALTPDRVGILLYDPAENLLLPKVIRRPLNSNEDIIISNSIIERAIDEKSALLVGDAAQDRRFSASESIATQQIRSVICAPLSCKGVLQGVLYLDRRGGSAGYDQNSLRLAAGIANQTSVAIANCRLHRQLLEKHVHERELAIARSIQEHLQPRDLPSPPGFELFGFNRPAQMVGGDYYDVIELPDGRVVMAVADVSGKGVPAAILLAEVRTAVQLETRGLSGHQLIDIMSRLNELLCRDASDNMFVTMVLAVLDPASRRLTYCNAGHVQSLLRSPNGRIEMLDKGGCLLGVIPGAVFEQDTIELAPGVTLLMYSDGVTDTMNVRNECFGHQRLSDLLGVLGKQPAEKICRRIDEAALDYSNGVDPFDDFTLLVLRALD